MGKRRRKPRRASRDAAAVLDRCMTADFDGHTAFRSLSPDQRLDALGQMIALVAELKGKAATPDARLRESPPPSRKP